MGAIGEQAALLRREWETSPRWAGIKRDYGAQDVIQLRGYLAEEHSLARRGASRLWDLLHSQETVRALPAHTGDRAVQAGSQALYLPGWHTSQSVSPVPQLVRQVNHALLDAEQAGSLAPVVADAEAGFGGAADAYEFMRSMIGAGAAGVGFEDQLSPDAGRGQRGGKVLIPTGQHIETLTAARLAADVLDVPALVIARTGAHLASLLTAATDDRDHEFLTGELSPEGYYRVQPGLYACVTRGLAFAPYADLLWMEAPEPDLAEARAFAGVIHSQYPGKMLAYSCSPSSSGQGHPDDAAAAEFRAELTAMGYRFQFTAAAGFRALDAQASELAGRNTPAYAER